MFKSSFKKQMQEAFIDLTKDQSSLFVTDVDRDLLYETYLNSFKEQEDRVSHTCNSCKQFIRNYGNVVAIKNNKIVTIWNFTAEDIYSEIPGALNSLVLSSNIKSLFLGETRKAGVDFNFQQLEDRKIQWDHMFLEIPKQFVNTSSNSRESLVGVNRDTRNVFKRGLDEITQDSVETVLELISQNSLYRGQEFKNILEEFLKHKKEYEKSDNKENYCWINSGKGSNAITKIRNSSIGSLLTDISEGKELDKAVTSFERMVAPTNYKRPTPVVTKGMVEEAEKTIEKLGLINSLKRRFAVVDDISINEVLYVNRDTKKGLGVFDEMKEDVQINPKSLSKIEEIQVDTFIKDVLPNTKNIEVLVENNHLDNLVSVIAPQDKEAPTLFKWDNNFSWSYTNAVTDSIKERVKSAGGRVDGEVRVSLSWFNYDDLDLHVIEPSRNIIYYGNAVNRVSGGNLDVDMNAGSGRTREAVENITWPVARTMSDGVYRVVVHNFSQREKIDAGFTIEVECRGELYSFDYDKIVKDQEKIIVVEFTYSKEKGIVSISKEGSSSKVLSKEKWGISTNKFQKVSMVMNSPNYWNNNIGNKHLFFMLEGAKSDENTRGFFNEFLKEDLLKNKRVFELLGSKMKVEPSDSQLSGLGFSSTQRNHLICKIEGKFKRTVKIIF